MVSCSKDDPDDVNEEELITTISYELNDINSSESIQLLFKDDDGDGGEDPIITAGLLKSNTTYSGELSLSNASEGITSEISEEAEDHQFFFQSTLADLMVSYSDMDSNGRPIGLRTQLTTGEAGIGQLTITLRHEPNKSASGVEEGDISQAGGSTDIEVTFDVIVE